MISTITIDIDQQMKPCQFLEYAADCRFILSVLDKPIFSQTTKIWDTRRGHHLEIHLQDETDYLFSILLQLALGSDRKREAYNLRREREGKFRSYLFDMKISKDGIFVNERNPILEAVWRQVFALTDNDFEQKYQMFRKMKVLI